VQHTQKNGKGLRAILFFASIVNLFLWGMQGLIASQWVADLWRISLPDQRFYVRIIGVFALVMGLLYYFAAKDPDKYRLFVKIAILQNGLLTIILLFAIAGMGFKDYLGISNAVFGFWVLNLVLCAFFTVSLYALLPRENRT
jgi:hypothetical protein